MTVPNILTVVGTGGVLMLAGALMLGTAAALGLSAALPAVPLWVWFLSLGLIMVGAGLYLLNKGGGETAEKVQRVEEELSPVGVAKNFPFVALAGGALAGFLVAKLFGGGGRRDIQVVLDPTSLTSAATAAVTEARVAPAPKKPTWFDAVLEKMVPLAAMAVSTAAGVGMKTLGIPEPAELIAELIGSLTRPADSRKKPVVEPRAYEPRPYESRPHNARF